MVEFNVIIYNINVQKFETYNVIPYLINCFKEKKFVPKTFSEARHFIEYNARYQWWARCEYEIILVDGSCQKVEAKWDIYQQVMMNIDLITSIILVELDYDKQL